MSKKELKNLDRVLKKYEGKTTRPMTMGELELMFLRFKISLEENPNLYSILEFIEQEDFRRNLFNTK